MIFLKKNFLILFTKQSLSIIQGFDNKNGNYKLLNTINLYHNLVHEFANLKIFFFIFRCH